MWQRYMHLVKTRPLLTNALTAGLIGGVGDVAAQQLENRFVKKQRGFLSVSELNFKRLGQISAWGFLWLGVPMYWWFRVLDKWFPPGVGGVKQLTKKILFNQTTMAPFSNATFFGFVQANQHGIEGLPARLATKLKGDFLYVTLNSCLFWVPAHVVNFLYVSPHLRVFFPQLRNGAVDNVSGPCRPSSAHGGS
eukprot:INCI14057.1.p1 GENE.INCI14057.1~~INCI14057.1.p1  ORF type:complete len:193 (-),score=32.76 INCI14057.1:807-1385(-)